MRYEVAPSTALTARVMASRDRVSANESPTAAGIPAENIPASGIIEAIPLAPEELARANAGQPYMIGPATYLPGRNDPDSERQSRFHTTAVQFQHASSSRLSWQGSYQRVHSVRTYTNGPTGPGSFQPSVENLSEFVGDIDTIDGRVIFSPTPWLAVNGGYEWEREAYADHIDDRLAVNRVDTRMRIVQRAHALYGAAQFGLLRRRLQLSVSGRVQSFDLSAPEFSTTGTVSPYDSVETVSPASAVTGDVSGAYFIASSATKLRAHAGNAYRAPALYERYGGGFYSDFSTGALTLSVYGDPRLDPDRYRSVDGGVDQYLWRDRVLLSATGFYVKVLSTTAFDLGNEIQFGTDPYGRFFGYVNGSGGRSRGIELSVEARPSPGVRLAASYTHTDASTDEDITVDGFFGVMAALEHTATFGITNRWTPRLETTFDVLHGSESFGSFTVGSFPTSAVRAYRYPSFTRAALVATYQLSDPQAVPVRAYVKADNLFNETYFLQGWRQVGRTVVAGVAIGR
jgi:iron complex outermembrane receptor protein